jgi:predicted YcjX-like family ATPase
LSQSTDDFGQRVLALAQRAASSIEATARSLAERALRRKLRVAVTGLSRAGKTVFLTALLHNLHLAARLKEGQTGHLPFFDPAAKGSLEDVTLRPLEDLPAFPFLPSLDRLLEPAPDFPPSTTGLSGFGAALRYRPQGLIGRQLVDTTTVEVEIIDYPGEWLLDLPMLEQSFEAWSATTLRLAESGARATVAGDWRTISPDAPANEDMLEAARLSYTAYLKACREPPLSLSFMQPGRFLRPGDGSVDVSAFRFCPLALAGADVRRGTIAAAMRDRFERYKVELVRPFYESVFSAFDRQLVLVDVVGALNAGPQSFDDMRFALSTVLRSFQRDGDGLLARLFRPRTDKVLFAATKADHVTANQFHNLRLLLRAMMVDNAGRLPVVDVETDFAALSAVKCTANKRVLYQGQQITVLEGIIKGHDTLEELFPGEIPEHLPTAEDWASERFRFYDFQPPSLDRDRGRGIPHIHLDKALQFLIGDLFW